MTWLQIIILGIVQGITEFLPVSSSGHLVVVESLFGYLGQPRLPDLVEVNILLHAGTLGAIVCYYWRRIVQLVAQDRRVVGLLIAGTIPAVAVGLPVERYASHLLEDPFLTGWMFLLTGGLLLWSGRYSEGTLDYVQLTYGQAILIGIFQAAAILPGLSRSGWTIAAGLLIGMRRDAAAAFSFLLAIPVIGGATVLQLNKLLAGQSGGTPTPVLAVGTAVAFAVGLISLWGLVKLVRHGRLAWFAGYLFPLGLAVILWQSLN
ncbi:MAG: undecaprenyl-diphosphate phosphatase [Planctomycetales bacterium]|nr:undecaprenyl-diphosphate phosphatase [Planctomycetales bacterium]NIP71307.1 undecaprenyl-diphosphate phosphatase [Planctomycetales bacterium]